MATEVRQLIRVLVADDEAEMRDTYRKILMPSNEGRNADKFRELRSKLYDAKVGDANGVDAKGAAPCPPAKRSSVGGRFDAVFCEGAESA